MPPPLHPLQVMFDKTLDVLSKTKLGSESNGFRVHQYLELHVQIRGEHEPVQVAAALQHALVSWEGWLAELKRDVLESRDPLVENAALQLISCLLYHARASSAKHAGEGVAQAFVKALLLDIVLVVLRNEGGVYGGNPVSAALMSLASQSAPQVLEPHLEHILSKLYSAMDTLSPSSSRHSVSVTTMALKALDRLRRQFPDRVLRDEGVWGILVVRALMNESSLIRRGAAAFMRSLGPQQLAQLHGTATVVLKEMEKIVNRLTEMLTNLGEIHRPLPFSIEPPAYVIEDIDGMDVWAILVQILGKRIHDSEQFRHIFNVLRFGSVPQFALLHDLFSTVYRNWIVLVENFAEEPQTVLARPGRAKLLMDVIRYGFNGTAQLKPTTKTNCLLTWERLLGHLMTAGCLQEGTQLHQLVVIDMWPRVLAELPLDRQGFYLIAHLIKPLPEPDQAALLRSILAKSTLGAQVNAMHQLVRLVAYRDLGADDRDVEEEHASADAMVVE